MKNPITKGRVLYFFATILIIATMLILFNFIHSDKQPKLYGNVYTKTLRLTSEASGTLSQFYVSEGAVLKKGDPIAQLVNDVFSTEITGLEIALEKAQLEQALQFEFYRLDSTTVQKLKFEMSQLQVKEVQFKLDQARNSLDKLIITSPTDGVLSTLYYEIGEQLPLNAMVAAIEMPNAQYVDYFVNYEHLGDFHLGQPVTLYASDRVFSANIVYIDHQSIFTPMNLVSTEDYNRLVYKVTLQLHESETLYDGLLLEWKVGDYYAD